MRSSTPSIGRVKLNGNQARMRDDESTAAPFEQLPAATSERTGLHLRTIRMPSGFVSNSIHDVETFTTAQSINAPPFTSRTSPVM